MLTKLLKKYLGKKAEIKNEILIQGNPIFQMTDKKGKPINEVEFSGDLIFMKSTLTAVNFKTKTFGHFTFPVDILPKDYSPQVYEIYGGYVFKIGFNKK